MHRNDNKSFVLLCNVGPIVQLFSYFKTPTLMCPLCVWNTDEKRPPREASAIIKAGKCFLLCRLPWQTSRKSILINVLESDPWTVLRWRSKHLPWVLCEPEPACRDPWCCCCRSSEPRYSLWWRLCTALLTSSTTPWEQTQEARIKHESSVNLRARHGGLIWLVKIHLYITNHSSHRLKDF